METFKRLEMIDFWRGLALVIIFINHIPLNFLSRFTPSNFNFSDCAEALVFISGVSCTLAYKRIFSSYNFLRASLPIIRRIAVLYASHITITVIGLMLIISAYLLTSNSNLLSNHDWLEVMIADPAELIFSVITFRQQFAYFDILPLYIFLLMLSPALLLLGLFNRHVMLVFSFALYLAARNHILSLPLNGSFFNPLAWQFMYAIGIYVGLTLKDTGLRYNRLLYGFCFAFTVWSTTVVTNMAGFWPSLWQDLGDYMDLSKTDLGTTRIIDFLTLGYVIYHTRCFNAVRNLPFFNSIARLGRNALAVFCVGTLLSIIGQIVTELGQNNFIEDIVFVMAGVALLHLVAGIFEQRNQLLRKS